VLLIGADALKQMVQSFSSLMQQQHKQFIDVLPLSSLFCSIHLIAQPFSCPSLSAQSCKLLHEDASALLAPVTLSLQMVMGLDTTTTNTRPGTGGKGQGLLPPPTKSGSNTKLVPSNSQTSVSGGTKPQRSKSSLAMQQAAGDSKQLQTTQSQSGMVESGDSFGYHPEELSGYKQQVQQHLSNVLAGCERQKSRVAQELVAPVQSVVSVERIEKRFKAKMEGRCCVCVRLCALHVPPLTIVFCDCLGVAELSLMLGLGHKYGAPKRSLVSTLRNEYAQSEQEAARIDALLSELQGLLAQSEDSANSVKTVIDGGSGGNAMNSTATLILSGGTARSATGSTADTSLLVNSTEQERASIAVRTFVALQELRSRLLQRAHYLQAFADPALYAELKAQHLSSSNTSSSSGGGGAGATGGGLELVPQLSTRPLSEEMAVVITAGQSQTLCLCVCVVL
jgi:hypothetical protein